MEILKEILQDGVQHEVGQEGENAGLDPARYVACFCGYTGFLCVMEYMFDPMKQGGSSVFSPKKHVGPRSSLLADMKVSPSKLSWVSLLFLQLLFLGGK